MKKFILAILFITIAAASAVFAADNNAQQKTEAKQEVYILKPKVQVGDFAFAMNLLNTIVISPQEVDVFLALKNQLQPVVDKIQKENPQANQMLEFDIPLPMANNLLEFLSRSKFQASEAERYKRFENAFVEAVQNLKK